MFNKLFKKQKASNNEKPIEFMQAPGAHGLKSIQVCRYCGKNYIKDYVDQNCCLECMKNNSQ